jgi:hypothetical protein
MRLALDFYQVSRMQAPAEVPLASPTAAIRELGSNLLQFFE